MNKFDCYISLAVIEAEKRMKASQNLPISAESSEIMALAEKYFSKLNIPDKSKLNWSKIVKMILN
ncbi:hypothetical protein [Leptospira vanthielii]|uniref:Uncharacterized protein n=1 Tax=Leptospira vanthielii serovar Holland str. Waz Holland = ATCC 700522 TaxID=1218591 RepID=N1VWU8_9LEPT|nr:hypothetical protein [Leptospira vanthielii]EMY68449.1 hypothetical protein LEP1GSC199_2949 [Leptospira vanthielii serovar Holland str. Waz Holland = ATCC 700522]